MILPMDAERRDLGGKTDTVCCTFMIPSLPPSVNSLYDVLFNLRRVELKPEVRLWKTRAKEFIPPFKVEKGQRVATSYRFYGRWRTKEGALRKVDVRNMVKAVEDSVCSKQGWDDSQVWEGCVEKVECDQEKVQVEIREYREPRE